MFYCCNSNCGWCVACISMNRVTTTKQLQINARWIWRFFSDHHSHSNHLNLISFLNNLNLLTTIGCTGFFIAEGKAHEKNSDENSEEFEVHSNVFIYCFQLKFQFYTDFWPFLPFMVLPFIHWRKQSEIYLFIAIKDRE